LQREIREKLTAFKPVFDTRKVFIMGDFYVKFDGLRKIVLKEGGAEEALIYQGQAPKSCCHNWDSSCTKEAAAEDDPTFKGRFRPVAIEGRAGTGECKKVKVNGVEVKTAGPGPRIPMGEQGFIENYVFTGDKVFGAVPSGDIQMYPAGRTGLSNTSDHEMVIGNFKVAAAGGRRKQKKSTRKQRSNRNHSRKAGRLAAKGAGRSRRRRARWP
jgi:hypothetical protein